MTFGIDAVISDATNRQWHFGDSDRLLDFLLKEADFWAKQDDSVEAVNDADKHPYIRAHTTLNKLVSEIKDICAQSQVVGGTVPMKIAELLRDNLSGDNWLWSGHDFIGTFIQFHTNTGIVDATNFVQAKITTEQTRLKFESVKNNFESWYRETKKNWDSLLDNSSKTHDKRVKTFDTFINDCAKRRDSLETIYEEKLSLAAPVTYWQNAAATFEAQGNRWVRWLMGSLVAGVIGFSFLFIIWLKGHATGIEFDTVQGIILFGTGLATFAFLIRTLSRLTFSSFHLMRDAQERTQLTYVYLALINEDKIDKSSRDIILQALFSRTETGLLAGESGPTMPGLGEVAIKSSLQQPGK